MFEGVGGDVVGLVARLRATEARIAGLHAEQLDLIAQLYRHAPGWIVSAPDHPGVVDAAEVAAAEIGVALRVSRRTAMDRLGLALALDGLPGTAAALRTGRISLAKARIITDAVADLTAAHATAVQDRVLPRAADQTPAGLGVSVARAVLAADPDAARRRHAAAVADRTVRYTPGTDGMASLWARLPAEDALGCYRELCELARTAEPTDHDGNPPDGPDTRTADARRADTLTDLIMGADLTRLTHRGCTHTPDDAGATDHTAADGGAADPTPDRPDTQRTPRPGRRPPRPGPRVDVTVAWTTLAGLDDQPDWLTGHGPIHADTARHLAADATWRRLLTDPATGTVVDVGTTRYTPPAALTALVRARDHTCRWYGCRHPATGCDLDHTVPYPHGPTTEDNLAHLCRGHHRLKTHTTWRLTHTPGGVLTWTSPTGQQVTTHPWPHDHDPPETDRTTAERARGG